MSHRPQSDKPTDIQSRSASDLGVCMHEHKTPKMARYMYFVCSVESPGALFLKAHL